MISKRDECFDQSSLNDTVEKCLMQSTQIKESYILNDTVQCGKHTMYFVKYIGEKQSERDRELALNREIRMLIKKEMKLEKLSIIIMRACNYYYEEQDMDTI